MLLRYLQIFQVWILEDSCVILMGCMHPHNQIWYSLHFYYYILVSKRQFKQFIQLCIKTLWFCDTPSCKLNLSSSNESLKNSSTVPLDPASPVSPAPLSAAQRFKWLKYFRCSLRRKKCQHVSGVKGRRVSSDLPVNQTAYGVNPALRWSHSAAPRLWSDKHKYEDSPLTWWQHRAPGLTLRATTALIWQLNCGRNG